MGRMKEKAMEVQQREEPREIAPLELGAEDDGIEGFLPEDYVIPRMKIVQKGDENQLPGVFLDLLTNDPHVELDVVFIRVSKGNKFWPKGADMPACFSTDGFKPHARVEAPVFSTCRVLERGKLEPMCPNSAWTKGDDGENKKPECPLHYSALAVNLTTMMPFLIEFGGSCYRPMNGFLTSFKFRRQRLRDVSVTLRLNKKQNGAFTWWVLDFADRQDTQPGEFDQYQQFAGYDAHKTYDAETAEGAAADEVIDAKTQNITPKGDDEDDLPF